MTDARGFDVNECAICGKVARVQDALTIEAFASVFLETGEPDWICKGHSDD